MMVVAEIKFSKFFFFSFVFLISLNLIYAQKSVNEECFDILLSKNPSLYINYLDYQKKISKSDFYPHLKPWDGLYFKDQIVFLKFFEYGKKTSFLYELSDLEKIKYGSLDWPNNNEYMFFEMYVLNPNTNIKNFAGCGYINTGSVQPYNLENIYGKDFWGCPGNSSKTQYEELGNWFFKRSQNSNCFNFENQPFISFNVDRVLYNDENLYINLYEIGKNHAYLRDRYSLSNYEAFEDTYYQKLYLVYPELKNHLRKGFLPFDWVYEDYENIKYHILKENIDKLTYPGVLESKKNENKLDNTYRKEVFIYLPNEDFEIFLDELMILDNNFNIDEFRKIETICLTLENVSCIGDSLTNFFIKYSNDVYAINFFVDIVLSQENIYYNVNDYGNLDTMIKNKQLIFGDKINSNNINNSSKDNFILNNKLLIIGFSIFLLILFIFILFIFIKKKNKK